MQVFFKRNSFIQSNAAISSICKLKKKTSFNISINILIKFLTLHAFQILVCTW